MSNQQLPLYQGASHQSPNTQMQAIAVPNIQSHGKAIDRAIEGAQQGLERYARFKDFGTRQAEQLKLAKNEADFEAEFRQKSQLPWGEDGAMYGVDGRINDDAITAITEKYKQENSKIESSYWLRENQMQSDGLKERVNSNFQIKALALAGEQELNNVRRAFAGNYELAMAKEDYNMARLTVMDAQDSGLYTEAEAKMEMLRINRVGAKKLATGADAAAFIAQSYTPDDVQAVPMSEGGFSMEEGEVDHSEDGLLPAESVPSFDLLSPDEQQVVVNGVAATASAPISIPQVDGSMLLQAPASARPAARRVVAAANANHGLVSKSDINGLINELALTQSSKWDGNNTELLLNNVVEATYYSGLERSLGEGVTPAAAKAQIKQQAQWVFDKTGIGNDGSLGHLEKRAEAYYNKNKTAIFAKNRHAQFLQIFTDKKVGSKMVYGVTQDKAHASAHAYSFYAGAKEHGYGEGMREEWARSQGIELEARKPDGSLPDGEWQQKAKAFSEWYREHAQEALDGHKEEWMSYAQGMVMTELCDKRDANLGYADDEALIAEQLEGAVQSFDSTGRKDPREEHLQNVKFRTDDADDADEFAEQMARHAKKREAYKSLSDTAKVQDDAAEAQEKEQEDYSKRPLVSTEYATSVQGDGKADAGRAACSIPLSTYEELASTLRVDKGSIIVAEIKVGTKTHRFPVTRQFKGSGALRLNVSALTEMAGDNLSRWKGATPANVKFKIIKTI